MNNPIKRHFQQIYNETGKKPFTFLNAFFMVFFPVIVAIVMTFVDANIFAVAALAALAVGIVINLIIMLVKFQVKGIGLFFLTLLASFMFFCSFIFWPFLKFSFRAAGAMFHANLGNITASVNASRRAGATKGKRSALNWFEYDGKVWKDEKEVMPEDIPNYSLDEGSYSYDQNQQARNHGYSNGKEAEMSGHKWNGSDWV